MEFRTPTTLDEVYEILNEIFHYYRLTRQEIQEIELPTLILPRLSEETFDVDIWAEAKAQLAGKQEREKLERRTTLKEKIDMLQGQLKSVDARYQEVKNVVLDEFVSNRNELYDFARKAGIHQSNILTDALQKLSEKKEQKLADIEKEKSNQTYDWIAQLEVLRKEYDNVDSYFEHMFGNEIISKMKELTFTLKGKNLEIEKYNNSQLEKELRFNATMDKARAELKLKMMQAAEEPLTRDQLIEMGYYKDVMKCVTSYFDTLPVVEAYELINTQPQLAIYLDDYYQSVLYLYQMRVSKSYA